MQVAQEASLLFAQQKAKNKLSVGYMVEGVIGKVNNCRMGFVWAQYETMGRVG
jgi:hypothetical protein